MAGGRIKGLTVTIDGDTTGLSGLWCRFMVSGTNVGIE